MSRYVQPLGPVLIALSIGACAGPKEAMEVTCADVFKGHVCTWAKTRDTSLVEAGATVPIATIENAPADQPMVWPPAAAAVIDMPASGSQSGFTQLTMFWENGGHPPASFLTPHFDFHFYTVSAAERTAMDCKDLGKPAALPVGYGLPDIPLPPDMAQMTGVPSLIGLCVPSMGMHAILTSEMERKDAMSGNMVIGYYKGKPIFIEPMLPRTMLMQKKSFDLPVPDVPGMTGAHPTRFHAEYDTTAKEYRFTFSAFTPAR